MTSIDELRRLLDERGVKWWEGEDEHTTRWESNGLTWEYFNDENGDAWLGFLGACENDVTPDQAIAATLGSGTCENMREKFGYNRLFVCSECGVTFDPDCEINYCPSCGRKIVTP